MNATEYHVGFVSQNVSVETALVVVGACAALGLIVAVMFLVIHYAGELSHR